MAKKTEWVHQKKSILDNWQVDIAVGKSRDFSAGRLSVTDEQIQIEAAGGLCHLGEVRGELPVSDVNHLIASYDQIKSVEIQTQFLLFHYLILTLKSNHLLVLRFGLESARRAKQRISERIR